MLHAESLVKFDWAGFERAICLENSDVFSVDPDSGDNVLHIISRLKEGELNCDKDKCGCDEHKSNSKKEGCNRYDIIRAMRLLMKRYPKLMEMKNKKGNLPIHEAEELQYVILLHDGIESQKFEQSANGSKIVDKHRFACLFVTGVYHRFINAVPGPTFWGWVLWQIFCGWIGFQMCLKFPSVLGLRMNFCGFLLSLFMTFKICFSDAGVVKGSKSDYIIALERHIPHVCYTCQHIKKKRMKHCKKCDHCVDKFHTHCPVAGTCIGRNNMRSYFLQLVNGVINATWLIINLYNYPLAYRKCQLLICLISCGLVVCNLNILRFCVFCISCGITANERINWRRLEWMHYRIVGSLKVIRNDFDRGFWQNWILFFKNWRYKKLDLVRKELLDKNF